MTTKELNEIHYLEREIKINASRLEALDTGNGTEEIADLKKKLEASVQRKIAQQIELLDYIDAIPDSLTRTIFTLRFSAGLDEKQTAEYLGGNFNAAMIRQRVKRQLAKSK